MHLVEVLKKCEDGTFSWALYRNAINGCANVYELQSAYDEHARLELRGYSPSKTAWNYKMQKEIKNRIAELTLLEDT